MEVKLLHHTPLHIASKAIRKCWASENKSDTGYCPQCETDAHGYHLDTKGSIAECDRCGTFFDIHKCGIKDKELIDRVGNKNKHASTLEHLNYSFDVDGVSRALLQEEARHRIGAISVKSTRYTLKELKNEEPFIHMYVDNEDELPVLSTVDGAIERARKYLVEIDGRIDMSNMYSLNRISMRLKRGEANDKVKYLLPESYKTSYVRTFNARALQNYLILRTDKAALWEIRELAKEMFNKLPEDHKYIFEHCIYGSDAWKQAKIEEAERTLKQLKETE